MRSFGLALVLGAALASGGCFQMTTVVSVKGDGSGTIDHTMLITKAALARLRQFAALSGGRGQSIDLVSEEQARANAATLGPGVTYVSSSPIDTPLVQGRRATYAFTDITQLHISEQPATPAGVSIKTQDLSTDTVPITLTITHEANGNAVLHINLPDPSLPAGFGGTTDNAGRAQQLAMVRTLLAGARILIAVEPQGTLVKTTSPYVDGQRVTLVDVDLDQLLGNDALIARLQATTSADEIRAAVKDAPGVKITLDREVTIEFTPAK
jgi:hypothetical protein